MEEVKVLLVEPLSLDFPAYRSKSTGEDGDWSKITSVSSCGLRSQVWNEKTGFLMDGGALDFTSLGMPEMPERHGAKQIAKGQTYNLRVGLILKVSAVSTPTNCQPSGQIPAIFKTNLGQIWVTHPVFYAVPPIVLDVKVFFNKALKKSSKLNHIFKSPSTVKCSNHSMVIDAQIWHFPAPSASYCLAAGCIGLEDFWDQCSSLDTELLRQSQIIVDFAAKKLEHIILLNSQFVPCLQRISVEQLRRDSGTERPYASWFSRSDDRASFVESYPVQENIGSHCLERNAKAAVTLQVDMSDSSNG
ncbi:hypothetical protein B0H11DRAFT_1931776 [Mycena galericulata]|nr:hypothetical protein B0H11DRAFT_1931776 [Mycena galericulata]